MATTRQLDELMNLLTKGTLAGSLPWQVTADEDAFRLEFGAANVRLLRSEDVADENTGPRVSRSLTVLNDRARVVEVYSPSTAEDVQAFDELYARARRSACKSDQVLESLMREIRIKVGA